MPKAKKKDSAGAAMHTNYLEDIFGGCHKSFTINLVHAISSLPKNLDHILPSLNTHSKNFFPSIPATTKFSHSLSPAKGGEVVFAYKKVIRSVMAKCVRAHTHGSLIGGEREEGITSVCVAIKEEEEERSSTYTHSNHVVMWWFGEAKEGGI